ncbi:hypothetical protein Bbelb_004820 [Branchiostoma belcheri]|nr:hypothetical protein Bbelb_004820 [Branchiostoma belcheri]
MAANCYVLRGERSQIVAVRVAQGPVDAQNTPAHNHCTMLDTEKEQIRSAKGKAGHPTMRPVPLISSVQRIVLYETKALKFSKALHCPMGHIPLPQYPVLGRLAPLPRPRGQYHYTKIESFLEP